MEVFTCRSRNEKEAPTHSSPFISEIQGLTVRMDLSATCFAISSSHLPPRKYLWYARKEGSAVICLFLSLFGLCPPLFFLRLPIQFGATRQVALTVLHDVHLANAYYPCNWNGTFLSNTNENKTKKEASREIDELDRPSPGSTLTLIAVAAAMVDMVLLLGDTTTTTYYFCSSCTTRFTHACPQPKSRK